jgi:lipoprotein-anchoring transpeptidase ErfK/SrfK
MDRCSSVRGPGFPVTVLVAGALWLLSACSTQPAAMLVANVADQATDVPLDLPLEVTAHGAVLDYAVLERLDSPGPAPELARTETQARLTAPLQPDATYRLVAAAHPVSSGWGWFGPAHTDLVLERVFATVRAPALVAPQEPVVLQHDAPLRLHFLAPLARARVAAPPEATAEIDPREPTVLQVRFAALAPGQEFELRLVDLLGRNGAPAPDRTLRVRTPEAVELVAVNGAPPSERLVVPPETAVAVEWSAPVAAVYYRLAGEAQVWQGEPTARLELPVQLALEESRTLEIEDARSATGGWLATPYRLTLAAPPPLRLEAVWPDDGAVGVTPEADPTFRFSEAIADREAAEAAIAIEPAVPGRFEWLAPHRLRFVPAAPFPSNAEVKVTIRGGPEGVVGVSGGYLPEDVVLRFQTGKLKVIDVSLSRQQLTLLEDGVPVWSAPVATGVRGAETPTGTYQVQYKMPVARFRGVNPNGTRYDIPNVRWVLAFYEDYTIHGAYWRRVFGQPGSAGCISLTDENAKVVYDWADIGTRIEIHR